MSVTPEPFETEILEFLLAGEQPIFRELRRQLDGITVASREHTGVGFYTNLRVAPGVPRIAADQLCIDDVNGTIDGVAHGVGFNVFVTNGYLDFLEGFTYDEEWPRDVRGLVLSYRDPSRTQLVTRFE